MSNVTVIEPRALTSGSRPSAIVPHSMDDALKLAIAICKARMAPKGMDTPEACMIAIMHGLEIGLTPMMALQRIAIVNGRPTLWGDGAMALVRSSGLCEWVRETTAGDGDNRIATCEVKRRGEPDPVARTFSVADAKKAGLWGKSGPWQQYPERMLQMRARAFALRDVFADALGGMYLREEMDDAPASQSRISSMPDDADSALISDEQADTIRELLVRTNANIPAFLGMMKGEREDQIPAARFEYAMGRLNQKLAAMEREVAQ